MPGLCRSPSALCCDEGQGLMPSYTMEISGCGRQFKPGYYFLLKTILTHIIYFKKNKSIGLVTSML